MSGMDKARLGWVVFSYVLLGVMYLFLGYMLPSLDQMLTTAIYLTLLFASVFLAFNGYQAATTEKSRGNKPRKGVSEDPLPMATCRCGRKYVKTQSKQSECTSCFFLESAAKAFPRG